MGVPIVHLVIKSQHLHQLSVHLHPLVPTGLDLTHLISLVRASLNRWAKAGSIVPVKSD